MLNISFSERVIKAPASIAPVIILLVLFRQPLSGFLDVARRFLLLKDGRMLPI